MFQNADRIKKIVLIVLILGLTLSMFPLLYISKLNHPYRDDFSYSIMTHRAYNESGSFFKVLGAAGEQVKSSYQEWQGTFSSVFLFSLNPALFSDGAYVLTAYILFTMFITGTVFFLYMLLVRLLNVPIINWLIITIVVVIISIQFIPSPFDAFYWYNGAIHYVFFYSLALALFGFVLLTLLNNTYRFYIYFAISAVLALIIGGGNFVTALNTAIILVLCVIYLIATKKKKWPFIVIIMAALSASMLISVLAPGNAVRAEFFEGYSPVQSVLKSFKASDIFIYTFYDAPKGTILCVVLALLAVVPLMGNVIVSSKYKFRYPAAVVLLLYCVLSAMFTPQFYGLGDKGPIRVENIIFFSFVLYSFFAMTYCAGYLYSKLKTYFEPKPGMWESKRIKIYFVYLAVIVVLFASCLYTITGISKNKQPTSIEAVKSIVSGEAYEYHFQNLDRLLILESDEEDVILTPITVHPRLLSTGDFVDERYEAYYEKNSVTVKGE